MNRDVGWVLVFSGGRLLGFGTDNILEIQGSRFEGAGMSLAVMKAAVVSVGWG